MPSERGVLMSITFGTRLAEERKRLGMSQEAFAEFVGVSFSTQRRYEKDSRNPDIGYLEALGAVGIDASYVLTGRLGGFPDKETFHIVTAYTLVIREIGARAGSDPDHTDGVASYPLNNPSVNKGVFDTARQVDRLFEGTNLTVHTTGLGNLIQAVEEAIQAVSATVTPEKKAQAIAILYGRFGHDRTRWHCVDRDTIKEALGLGD